MKKMIIILILSFILISQPSFAQAEYPMIPTYVATETASVVAAGKEIYGYTIIASGGAIAIVGLYDSASLGATSTANIIAEESEATQHNSHTIWFPKPLITANGCSVVLNNATAIIYHQP